MAFDFVETVSFKLPDNIDEQLSDFSESTEGSKTRGLIVEIASIHEGMTANHNYYSATALEDSLDKWVTPYPKPIIKNHDLSEEPLGRVIAAKLDYEEDGTPYIRLQVALTDESAITKAKDKRYLTGSVGGKVESATCSICETDWAASESICKHRRGKRYDEKVAFLNMSGITWKEYSIVNAPADNRSMILSQTENDDEVTQEGDGWVRAARVFSIDMGEEKIVEHSDKGEFSLLESVQDKEKASSIYNSLKGSFLSAIEINENHEPTNNKESQMSDKDEILEEEDILSVSEELSSDLAAEDVSDAEKEESEDADIDSELSEAPEGDEADETPSEEEQPEEANDDNKEDSEEVEETPAAPEEETSDEAPEEEATEEPLESDAELTTTIKALEEKIEENTDLTKRLETANERNNKLEAALKRSLAERVVDTKIAVGLTESSTRSEQVEEHVTRTAGSLADTLRDLSSMSITKEDTPSNIKLPAEMETTAAAVPDRGSVTGESDLEEEQNFNPEDVFFEALMGKRML